MAGQAHNQTGVRLHSTPAFLLNLLGFILKASHQYLRQLIHLWQWALTGEWHAQQAIDHSPPSYTWRTILCRALSWSLATAGDHGTASWLHHASIYNSAQFPLLVSCLIEHFYWFLFIIFNATWWSPTPLTFTTKCYNLLQNSFTVLKKKTIHVAVAPCGLMHWCYICVGLALTHLHAHHAMPQLSVGPGAVVLLTFEKYLRIRDSPWNIPYPIVTTRTEVEQFK